ncbi:Retrovirus-related Pol polyprotein from transposon RE1 [Bienertia sinuspersici]
MSLLNKHQPIDTSDTTPYKTDTEGDTNAGQASLAGKLCLLTCSGTYWILDSEATDHICSHLSLFDSYEPVNDTYNTITIPDGRQIPVAHIDSVKLNHEITLHNVLHVPTFHFNLNSVHKLCCDLNYQIIFDKKQCIVQGLTQRNFLIQLGNHQDGLYPVQHSCLDVSHSVSSVHKTSPTLNDAQLWHMRLGHIPFHQLQLLHLVNDVNKSVKGSVC